MNITEFHIETLVSCSPAPPTFQDEISEQQDSTKKIPGFNWTVTLCLLLKHHCSIAISINMCISCANIQFKKVKNTFYCCFYCILWLAYLANCLQYQNSFSICCSAILELQNNTNIVAQKWGEQKCPKKDCTHMKTTFFQC